MVEPESLSDKLKSLGVRSKVQPPAPPAPQKHEWLHRIEEVVNGRDYPTPLGSTFISEQHYLLDYTHGGIPLCKTCDLQTLAAWGSAKNLNDPSLQNVVFLDTETTGLMGGTGTHVFLIGIGYHNGEGFHLAQFFMRDPSEESAMLTALVQWLASFNVIVTFNGKTFDLPLLYTRFTLNSVNPPFGEWDHLDLLHLARRLWRSRLPSRALGDLEREIVRFARQGDDIPGAMIPELYFQYLRSGDARPLEGVFYHNAMDILSLAALFNHMASLLTEPTRLAAEIKDGGLDVAAVARLYEEKGQIEKAAELYQASLDQGLPRDFFFKTIERYAQMRRKQGEWEHAARLWQLAAEQGLYNGCIELAKYHEHRTRNYAEAARWIFEAMQMVPFTFKYEYARRDADRELKQRLERIKKKMGK